MASRFSQLAKKALEEQEFKKSEDVPLVSILGENNAEGQKIEEKSEEETDLKNKNGRVDREDGKKIDLSSIAWQVHSTNKAAQVMKRRANLRLNIKERIRSMVEKRLTVRQIFKRYVESSTLHGFRYTCTKTYLARRIIWACLMIMGAVYFIIKLQDGLRLFFKYPFSTKSTMEYTDQLFFPAISFCPINQFKYDYVKNSSLNQLLMDKRLPLSSHWKSTAFDIPGEELFKNLYNTSFAARDIYQACDWISQHTQNRDIPFNYCGLENFTSYFNGDGKLCFTLNSGKPGHKKLKVEHAGLKYGFELMFDLRVADAIQNHAISGLQVIVHDQADPPTFSTGFVLAPGFKTFVQLEVTEIENLPPPYSTNCGSIPLQYFSVYNQKACLLELLTNYTSEICKCRDVFMPDNGLPFCSLKKTKDCMLPAKDSFNEHEMRLKCPIDCVQTVYDQKLSDSRFLHDPPIGLEKILVHRTLAKKNLTYSHILHLQKRYEEKDLDAYIEQNIVVVVFYYAELLKVVTKQAPTYNFYNFLGDMGGTFGLMLGASLLTFVEFVDLIIFLLYHQLLRLRKQRKSDKNRKTWK